MLWKLTNMAVICMDDFSWMWKSVVIIIFGIFLLRLSGRRSISQMTISQTVIMISIGTLLIQPISGQNVWVTLATAAMLIIILSIIEYIQLKWDFTETIFTGRSKVIIENGQLNEKNLKKLRLTVDKLEMRLRQNGIENVKDVKWGTVEASGQLGYLLVEKKKLATKEDIDKVLLMLSNLTAQVNVSTLQQQTEPNPNNSNVFTEINGGHNPPIPERLE